MASCFHRPVLRPALVLGALLAVAPVAPVAAAQVNVIPTIPPSPKASDLDEPDDIVPESEFLPADGEDDADGTVAEINRQQAKELRETHAEIRGRHDYALSLGLGSSKPWQVLTVEAASLAVPGFELGIYAGTGHFTSSSIVSEKSYDLQVSSRSAGVSARYHFSRLQGLSVETVLGYGAWEGHVTLYGADEDVEDDPDKVTAGFNGNGVVFGLSTALTWLWDNGVFLEWTPIGVRRTKLLQKDLTRDTDAVRRAVSNTVERPALYVLTNLELGYLF
jgi:hypothetical protein